MEGAPGQEQHENQDLAYEALLAQAKEFKAAGVKGLSKRTPETAEFHDALKKWRQERQTGINYVKTLDKAKAIVRNARLFLDAGYTGSTKKTTAGLIEEALLAGWRDHVSPDIIAYLDTELEKVASDSNISISPESDISSMEALPAKDALYQISSMLIYPELKRGRWAPLRARLIEMRERIRTREGMPPTPPYNPGPKRT